jgi:hypothetical protein
VSAAFTHSSVQTQVREGILSTGRFDLQRNIFHCLVDCSPVFDKKVAKVNQYPTPSPAWILQPVHQHLQEYQSAE